MTGFNIRVSNPKAEFGVPCFSVIYFFWVRDDLVGVQTVRLLGCIGVLRFRNGGYVFVFVVVVFVMVMVVELGARGWG